MHHLITSAFLAGLLLLGSASAAPRYHSRTSHLEKRTSFRVDRVAVPAAAPKSAAKAARKAFNKFGMKMPNGLAQQGGAGGAVSDATATSQTGDVANTPEDGDVEFVAPITVGGQTIVMDFDTGSSDLYV